MKIIKTYDGWMVINAEGEYLTDANGDNCFNDRAEAAALQRQAMIHALAKFELRYLIDNPECLDDECAQWWIEGGFNNYADADLIRNCEMNIWPELEVQA